MSKSRSCLIASLAAAWTVAAVIGGAALLLSPVALAANGPVAAKTAPASPTTQSPSEIVDTSSRHIVATVVERREEFRAQPAKMHAFIDATLRHIFDREYSARLVLAQHGRGASQEAVNAFAEALTDNLLRRYGNALVDVDPGLDMRIKSETPLRGGAIVRVATEIDRPGGAPVQIDYLFRDTEHGWKAFDVIVEGISYVQTYRTQFAEQLRGKSLAQVTSDLRAGLIDVTQ